MGGIADQEELAALAVRVHHLEQVVERVVRAQTLIDESLVKWNRGLAEFQTAGASLAQASAVLAEIRASMAPAEQPEAVTAA